MKAAFVKELLASHIAQLPRVSREQAISIGQETVDFLLELGVLTVCDALGAPVPQPSAPEPEPVVHTGIAASV